MCTYALFIQITSVIRNLADIIDMMKLFFVLRLPAREEFFCPAESHPGT